MSLDRELDGIDTDRLQATYESLLQRISGGTASATSAVSIQRFPALHQILDYVDRIVAVLNNEDEEKQIKGGAVLALAMLAEYAVNSQIDDELLPSASPDFPE